MAWRAKKSVRFPADREGRFNWVRRLPGNMNTFTVIRLIFNTKQRAAGTLLARFVRFDGQGLWEAERSGNPRKKEGEPGAAWRCEVKGVPGQPGRQWWGGGEGMRAENSWRRAFVGGCRSLLRDPGTRGHECLSTVRYDAWITPFSSLLTTPLCLATGKPPLQPFPLSTPSRAAFAIRRERHDATYRQPRFWIGRFIGKFIFRFRVATCKAVALIPRFLKEQTVFEMRIERLYFYFTGNW